MAFLRLSLAVLLVVALHGGAFAEEAAARPDLASNTSAGDAARDHGALPELASNTSAGEVVRGETAPAGLATPAVGGGAGLAAPAGEASRVVSLVASSLRGSLRGTRCICETSDPAVLTCATRYTDEMDCFWDCEQACAKKGFKVKQCAASVEVPGVTNC